MPQSLTKLFAHLIFSTKNRERLLTVDIRDQVHAFMSNTVRELGSPWVVVGGIEDHVHLLFDMGKTTPAVRFVEQVKRESSKYAKTLGPKHSNFFWQRGYGMFSVSPKERESFEHYVLNQELHHRELSFQDEYRAILKRYGIQYDERYVWD